MKTFAMTDMGQKRNVNQDFVFTSETPVGNLPNLFIVADGMGGHNAGDLASKFTVETVVQLIRDSERSDPADIIGEAIVAANDKLLDIARASQELSGMGTTIVVCTIKDACLYTVNVGDSRLYVINEDIRQITTDHSLVEEMVRIGEIEKEDARNHPDKNIITRAIGASANVEPDFFESLLSVGDMVLMCTDGLTNMVEDEEIRQIMLSQRDVVERVESLIERANANGGKDNIGVIVIEPFSGEVNV